MTTEWIPISYVRPGDRVKVPLGSRREWPSRVAAGEWDVPFRTVERVEHEAEGPGTVALTFEDGFRGCYPANGRVLRAN